jgi:hypothetical protein
MSDALYLTISLTIISSVVVLVSWGVGKAARHKVWSTRIIWLFVILAYMEIVGLALSPFSTEIKLWVGSLSFIGLGFLVLWWRVEERSNRIEELLREKFRKNIQ